MIRRYGKAPNGDQRYRVRHGAYAVLLRGRSMLLTWQGGIHDEMQLPGGGIDPGESALRALHREVYEETGWHITAPRRLGTYRRFTWMPEYQRHAEKVCHIYLARPTMRMGPPTEPDHSAVWMDLGQAVSRLDNTGDAAFAAGVARWLAL
ncbi:MAG: NUDIX hydrolase [Loktanella sp.]|nr:NUDIX hydrolase [Loktanella sp.]